MRTPNLTSEDTRRTCAVIRTSTRDWRRDRVKYGVLLLALAASPGVLAGPVSIRDRVEHYAISGDSATALAEQMALLGPIQPLGRRAWGLTSWELRTNYTLVPGPADCRLAGTAATLEVLTTLPRWVTPERARWSLRRAWQRMYQHILAHEQVHRSHAIDAAHAVVAALAALPPAVNCPAMERAARLTLKHAVMDARRTSRAFDRETNYGARQGVYLQP